MLYLVNLLINKLMLKMEVLYKTKSSIIVQKKIPTITFAVRCLSMMMDGDFDDGWWWLWREVYNDYVEVDLYVLLQAIYIFFHSYVLIGSRCQNRSLSRTCIVVLSKCNALYLAHNPSINICIVWSSLNRETTSLMDLKFAF